MATISTYVDEEGTVRTVLLEDGVVRPYDGSALPTNSGTETNSGTNEEAPNRNPSDKEK